MNVYELHAEGDRKWVRFFAKKNLAFPLSARDERAFFDVHPKIAIDRNTDSTPRGSKAKLADFSNVNYNSHPIFSERAKQVFSPHIHGLGRWVELECDEAPYWLFWVTNVVDALDENLSELRRFSDGGIMRIASFAFRPKALEGQWLFRTPQGDTSPHVTQHFVDLVREHQLTGFMFLRLWSSETGPTNLQVKDWLKPRITGLESRLEHHQK